MIIASNQNIYMCQYECRINTYMVLCRTQLQHYKYRFSAINKMTEKEVEQTFQQFDKTKKGFLTLAEYKPFAEYITTVYNSPEDVVSLLTHFVVSNEKVKLVDIKRILFEKPVLSYMQKYSYPGAKIIEMLKQVSEMPEVDSATKSEILWGIEQILEGKLYTAEFDATQKKERVFAWLENFSTPQLTTETIQSYSKVRQRFKPRTIAAGRRRKSHYAKNLVAEARLLEQNAVLMATIDSPNFDIFKFAETFGRDRTTEIIAYQVFRAHKAFSRLDEEAFEDFIVKIRKGYQDNEYHNDLHAADVLQMCHFMLLNGLQEIAQLDSLDVNAFLLSAIIHDFMHPGVNNGYLQNSKSELALLYNDQSVLENYHVSQAFKLIWRDPNCGIFKKLTKEEAKIIRKRVIQCVLSTDNARHFEVFSDMQTLISAFEIRRGKNSEKIVNASSPLKEFESKQRVLNICLHAADISNPTRPFLVAQEAAKRVMEEFHLQGDMEKSKELPVSFLCDRKVGTLPGAQVGFVGGIVRPYFEKLVEIFPGFSQLLTNVKCVEEEWRKLNQAGVNKQIIYQQRLPFRYLLVVQ
eukprot:TRINITY_DN70791_c3_g1_i1.p1 TRINITY_DN70791_c3_g1~~TRINITY_DN70791_c3_g1_i1.p1  ORF type:complete len:578 (+),score=48.98 TRINITY_DN70791_c3_g1_i1:104-1837(+)